MKTSHGEDGDVGGVVVTVLSTETWAGSLNHIKQLQYEMDDQQGMDIGVNGIHPYPVTSWLDSALESRNLQPGTICACMGRSQVAQCRTRCESPGG